MAMHPEAQAKAQAELDAVVGRDRLPDFGDYDSLPYILATMKEIMRWQLVLPLGLMHHIIWRPVANILQTAVAHACTADDEYDGFFIPAGSIVMGNSWYVVAYT